MRILILILGFKGLNYLNCTGGHIFLVFFFVSWFVLHRVMREANEFRS